jgi:hypothetical protein
MCSGLLFMLLCQRALSAPAELPAEVLAPNPLKSFVDGVRREVDERWQENLEKLSSKLDRSRPSYTTKLGASFAPDGSLAGLEVLQSSGSVAFDDCILRSFREAAPFERPPASLLSGDRTTVLSFDFMLQLASPVVPPGQGSSSKPASSTSAGAR